MVKPDFWVQVYQKYHGNHGKNLITMFYHGITFFLLVMNIPYFGTESLRAESCNINVTFFKFNLTVLPLLFILFYGIAIAILVLFILL